MVMGEDKLSPLSIQWRIYQRVLGTTALLLYYITSIRAHPHSICGMKFLEKSCHPPSYPPIHPVSYLMIATLSQFFV